MLAYASVDPAVDAVIVTGATPEFEDKLRAAVGPLARLAAT